MHISEIKRLQEQKDYLMRHEGEPPANYNENSSGRFANGESSLDRFRKTEGVLPTLHRDNPENMPNIGRPYKSKRNHSGII